MTTATIATSVAIVVRRGFCNRFGRSVQRDWETRVDEEVALVSPAFFGTAINQQEMAAATATRARSVVMIMDRISPSFGRQTWSMSSILGPSMGADGCGSRFSNVKMALD